MTTSYTVAQYKAWVRGRLPGLTLADALLLDVISSANRDICNGEPWPFLERSFEGTAASGNREFDLQATISTFQVPLGLKLTAPDSSAVSVRYMTWQEYYRLYPDPDQLTATRPWMWSLYGTTLIIGPAKLDQTYTFRLPYIKEPTPLTADADVVDIPDAFAEVLIVAGKVRALKSKRKYNEAQVEQQEYDGGDGTGGLLGNMKRRLVARQDGEVVEMGNGYQSVIPRDPYGDYET